MFFGTIGEIFCSIQGEGPWVGERHIFVRFAGCDIACRFCDTRTEDLSRCSVQLSSSSFESESVPLTFTSEQLTACCDRLLVPGPARPTVSLTGGEPLLQVDFLKEWLAGLNSRFRIYLETNGIHHDAVRMVRDQVDVVSMDLKLPSATGLRPYWSEHERFLSGLQGWSVFGKAVITADTSMEDVLTAARILANAGPSLVLVLQPATGALAPGPERLMRFQDKALCVLNDVRVIPQVHHLLGLP